MYMCVCGRVSVSGYFFCSYDGFGVVNFFINLINSEINDFNDTTF